MQVLLIIPARGTQTIFQSSYCCAQFFAVLFLLCNICCAIYVAQSESHLSCAIFVAYSVFCNLCFAIFAVQSVLCNLWRNHRRPYEAIGSQVATTAGSACSVVQYVWKTVCNLYENLCRNLEKAIESHRRPSEVDARTAVQSTTTGRKMRKTGSILYNPKRNPKRKQCLGKHVCVAACISVGFRATLEST